MSDKKYVLSVPNFSDGRNKAAIDEVVAAVAKVESVKIVAVEPEANFNRTVLTFISEPQFVKEALLNMAGAVYKNVDMTVQSGDHPRIGALDTAPVFPLQNVSVDEVKALAEEIGQSLFDTYKVPVYFSGLNARTEYKASNTRIRKGQYEGLKALLDDPATDAETRETRQPDLSVDGKLSPTMGGCTVSADLEGLTAFNVFLATEDVPTANGIAKVVKSPDTGWDTIKGIGFKDDGHVGTAVSMNVFDAANTPLNVITEFVGKEAGKVGTEVIATQIVGPVKAQYLLDSAKNLGYTGADNDYAAIASHLEANMKLEGFNVTSIIEYHI
jgi:glutamate formiminotransferase / 5-formyltetrahydrofolate cyclo-ligase